MSDRVPTSIDELRARSTKVVTSPTGLSYRIRRVSQLELTEMQMNSLLTTGDRMDPAMAVVATLQDPKKTLSSTHTALKMLESCVLEPRLSCGPLEDVPPDRVHVSAITPDDTWLVKEITEFSGLGASQVLVAENIAKNVNGSE